MADRNRTCRDILSLVAARVRVTGNRQPLEVRTDGFTSERKEPENRSRVNSSSNTSRRSQAQPLDRTRELEKENEWLRKERKDREDEIDRLRRRLETVERDRSELEHKREKELETKNKKITRLEKDVAQMEQELGVVTKEKESAVHQLVEQLKVIVEVEERLAKASDKDEAFERSLIERERRVQAAEKEIDSFRRSHEVISMLNQKSTKSELEIPDSYMRDFETRTNVISPIRGRRPEAIDISGMIRNGTPRNEQGVRLDRKSVTIVESKVIDSHDNSTKPKDDKSGAGDLSKSQDSYKELTLSIDKRINKGPSLMPPSNTFMIGQKPEGELHSPICIGQSSDLESPNRRSKSFEGREGSFKCDMPIARSITQRDDKSDWESFVDMVKNHDDRQSFMGDKSMKSSKSRKSNVVKRVVTTVEPPGRDRDDSFDSKGSKRAVKQSRQPESKVGQKARRPGNTMMESGNLFQEERTSDLESLDSWQKPSKVQSGTNLSLAEMVKEREKESFKNPGSQSFKIHKAKNQSQGNPMTPITNSSAQLKPRSIMKELRYGPSDLLQYRRQITTSSAVDSEAFKKNKSPSKGR